MDLDYALVSRTPLSTVAYALIIPLFTTLYKKGAEFS